MMQRTLLPGSGAVLARSADLRPPRHAVALNGTNLTARNLRPPADDNCHEQTWTGSEDRTRA